MTKHSPDLDTVFRALADPTRRRVLDRLSEGPQGVTALAAGEAMALPSFLSHIRALEAAGLVVTEKVGRVRRCALVPARMAEAEAWLAERRRFIAARLHRLGDLLEGDDAG